MSLSAVPLGRCAREVVGSDGGLLRSSQQVKFGAGEEAFARSIGWSIEMSRAADKHNILQFRS